MKPKDIYVLSDFTEHANKSSPDGLAACKTLSDLNFSTKTYVDEHQAPHQVDMLLVGHYWYRCDGTGTWACATGTAVHYFYGSRFETVCTPVPEYRRSRIYFDPPFSTAAATQQTGSGNTGWLESCTVGFHIRDAKLNLDRETDARRTAEAQVADLASKRTERAQQIKELEDEAEGSCNDVLAFLVKFVFLLTGPVDKLLNKDGDDMLLQPKDLCLHVHQRKSLRKRRDRLHPTPQDGRRSSISATSTSVDADDAKTGGEGEMIVNLEIEAKEWKERFKKLNKKVQILMKDD
ncbi:hypothetical protein E8E11_008229 [Didymella keratinophila]|nr:hypothetical protein E8E11_008229 [Didymella keratinophila]